MNRIFQQGHWVDEKYQEWPNVYDVSTPELTNKVALPAFKLYLDHFEDGGKNLPDNKEYTLEDHKKEWTWRGGDEDPGPQSNVDVPGEIRYKDQKHMQHQAWQHFYFTRDKFIKDQKELNEVYAAFLAGDGETVLKFLDGFDNISLCFKVVNLKDEFVVPPIFDDDEDE